jgi:hypothetical protein
MDQSVVVSLGGGAGDQWIGLVGALVGAVLGAAGSGYASYVLQRREHDRADTVRDADLRQRQRSIAHGLLVKLIEIASDLSRTDSHIKQQFAEIDQPEAAWAHFLPLYQPFDDMTFDRDESALLLDLGLNDEFNLAGPLPGIRNQIASLMNDYAARRDRLWDMMPEEAFVRGGVEMSPALFLKTERLRAEMMDILGWLKDSAPRSSTEANAALMAVYKGLRTKLDITFHMELVEIAPQQDA